VKVVAVLVPSTESNRQALAAASASTTTRGGSVNRCDSNYLAAKMAALQIAATL